LAVFDGGGGGPVVELGEESFEVFGEGEVGVAVDELGVERVELVALAGLAGAELRHPGAEFVEGDQVFLVCLDEAGDGGGGLGQGALQPGLGRGGWVGSAQLVEATVDFGADQAGVGEEGGDVGPDDLVEVVSPDGFVVADPAADVAVVVGAEAPVVVDGFVGGAGRCAVVGVAAARADGQAWSSDGVLLLRVAKRLLSASRRPASSKVASLTSGGTGIPIQSWRGRSVTV
jgi:hypothetical protein